MNIEHYQSVSGRDQFQKWFDSLDRRHQVIVERRLATMEAYGHIGDCRSLRSGLFELRLMGSGLRIYFGKIGQDTVLMLGGSNKDTQNRAIAIARKRLQNFKERSR